MSKLGEHEEHGEHREQGKDGKHQPDDSKHYIPKRGYTTTIIVVLQKKYVLRLIVLIL